MIRNAFTALLFIVTSSAFAQFSVEGTVTDEAGTPLEGANILIRENNTGTISDPNGKFRFDIPNAGMYTVQVSFLGYETYVNTLFIDHGTRLSCSLKSTTF